MKRFYCLLLQSLIAFCLINAALAADNLDEEKQDEASEKSGLPMIRQVTPVAGYQALVVAGQNIDAAYNEETLGERHGAVILFHDQGAAFDSDVIKPLREGLVSSGWSTLTLALHFPLESNVMLSTSLASPDGLAEQDEQAKTEDNLANEASENDSSKTLLPPVANTERVMAALAFLEGKGIEQIVFVGHGKGADIAVELMTSQRLPVAGMVLLGMADVVIDDDFKRLDIPMLDIFGQRDFSQVKLAVKQRKAAMKRVAKLNYGTREITGADHDFYGLMPALLMTVRSWLNVTFAEQGQL